MEHVHYLRMIRRRWPVIVGMVLIGMAVAYATAPAASSPSHPRQTAIDYHASSALAMQSPNSDPSGLTIDSMAYLASTGRVAALTAQASHGKLTASQVQSRVQATARDALNVLQISASGATPRGAASLANAFSAQMIAFVNSGLVQNYHASLASSLRQLSSLQTVITQLQAQPSSPLVVSELSQAQSQYAQQEVAYRQLLASGPSHTGLHVVEPASSAFVSVSVPHHAKATTISKKRRLELGGLAGLLVGLGLAFIWERKDLRVDDREDAERIAGEPVLGEVTVAPSGRRARRQLVVLDDASSTASEAYRMLQTNLSLVDTRGNGRGRQAILLCSPSRLEGREAVVANLAACFSETGVSVAVVTADPFDHRLSALLRQAGREDLCVGTNGNRAGTRNGSRPGAELVRAARDSADVVLVDAPPVLSTHDAGRLSPSVDIVVLLCELGAVTPGDLSRAVDSFRRIGAPLRGVVLVRREGFGERFSSRWHPNDRPPRAAERRRDEAPVSLPDLDDRSVRGASNGEALRSGQTRQ